MSSNSPPCRLSPLVIFLLLTTAMPRCYGNDVYLTAKTVNIYHITCSAKGLTGDLACINVDSEYTGRFVAKYCTVDESPQIMSDGLPPLTQHLNKELTSRLTSDPDSSFIRFSLILREMLPAKAETHLRFTCEFMFNGPTKNRTAEVSKDRAMELTCCAHGDGAKSSQQCTNNEATKGDDVTCHHDDHSGGACEWNGSFVNISTWPKPELHSKTFVEGNKAWAWSIVPLPEIGDTTYKCFVQSSRDVCHKTMTCRRDPTTRPSNGTVDNFRDNQEKATQAWKPAVITIAILVSAAAIVFVALKCFLRHRRRLRMKITGGGGDGSDSRQGEDDTFLKL